LPAGALAVHRAGRAVLLRIAHAVSTPGNVHAVALDTVIVVATGTAGAPAPVIAALAIVAGGKQTGSKAALLSASAGTVHGTEIAVLGEMWFAHVISAAIAAVGGAGGAVFVRVTVSVAAVWDIRATPLLAQMVLFTVTAQASAAVVSTFGVGAVPGAGIALISLAALAAKASPAVAATSIVATGFPLATWRAARASRAELPRAAGAAVNAAWGGTAFQHLAGLRAGNETDGVQENNGPVLGSSGSLQFQAKGEGGGSIGEGERQPVFPPVGDVHGTVGCLHWIQFLMQSSALGTLAGGAQIRQSDGLMKEGRHAGHDTDVNGVLG
jgi:hypothetical protein